MATTAQTIIDAAYRKIGITSPTSTEDDNALEMLNNMLGLWGSDFLVSGVTRESLSLVVGTAEYTIGSGGDLDTVRPLSIKNCYLKDSDDYSYPVDVNMSAKDYNRISSKTLESRPTELYFIPEYPLAKIIFNCESDKTYTAYFEFWKEFTEFAALNTAFNFPNEYKEAMVYNLAVRLAEDNSLTVSQPAIESAYQSLALISRLSAINRPAAISRFDFAIGSSNIETGEC